MSAKKKKIGKKEISPTTVKVLHDNNDNNIYARIIIVS